MLRYSYKNQPSIIWWNLVRLGETFGELIGAGDQVEDTTFVEKGVSEEFAPTLIKRAETLIERAGDEYKAVFMAEYKRLMTARLGLQTQKTEDFEHLYSELLDTMEELELDFNHFFRRLSSVKVGEIETEEQRKEAAGIFFHKEGVSGVGVTDAMGRDRLGKWLGRWRERVIEDWGQDKDQEREKAMKAVNPKVLIHYSCFNPE